MTDWTIAEAARRIAARQLSPVELTTELLGKVEALEPQLNAFIRPTPELAMQQARAAEAEIAASGPRGPLHGIPFGLKDIFGTRGIPTTGHSRSAEGHVPAEDAVTVAKLYEAGGVLMGKLATHEFAHGGPSFDLPWPPARNPWNTAHVTGGSSSGSGAAVAAGLVLGAMGSDTGGSIRNPAALCGIAGLKPTYGLLSRRGVWTNSFSYDHAGPMAWTAEDCAIMLDALAGHDPGDPASADRPKVPYQAALTGDIRGMRIGVLRELYETDVPVPAVARAAMEAALEVLRGLGAVLEDVRIRPAADYYAVKVLTAESELYAVHEKGLRENPEKFGEDFLGRSLAAILIRAEDYMQAQRERRVMLAEFEPLYAKYDALVTAAPGPAPRLEAWRTIHFWQKGSLTTPFNVSGGPAMSQCIGFTPEGLPLSMQVAGRPFDDAVVLRLADAYERATPWRERRPALVAGAAAPPLPPVPDPTPAEVTPAERDAIALIARRAGLTLNARQFELLCAAAPYVEQMAGRLRRARRFTEEPASVFTFGA
ncbi:amidase [Paeniroseomonas aquatica]|uniref:Amidase n=1 Tax=Paeniroseomonas aquatica TaxID=373043 RepID=A0ABT8AAK4_9PROT|nr:amidase [Paeniroseomonas aquatica]MDN3566781.1 amidase [Paeniroseomonas aquatica]